MTHTLGIVPARYGSTRLPGKPLIKVKGKTIIQRVYERARMASSLDRVIVATDDVRIFNHIKKIGGEAMMTRQDHKSGTTRCAEVLGHVPGYDYVINVQGDEPLINPKQIDDLVAFILADPTRQIATMTKRVDRVDELKDPSVAKVALNRSNRVLYFSRSAIPHVRGKRMSQWMDDHIFFKHVGIYAYSIEALNQIALLPESTLEAAELLEQVNWLYHGLAVHAVETDIESIGIDTEADVALLEHILSLADE